MRSVILNRVFFRLLCAIALVGFNSAAFAALPLESIKLPPGFTISLFADNIRDARSMVLGDQGTLFVSTRKAGQVYAVRHDGRKAQKVFTLASGLNMPNGVAFRNGALYVAEVHRILRFDDIETKLENPPPFAIVSEQFPRDSHHGWKFIRFGPDGKLYVPIGAPCNICDREPPYASITRIAIDTPNAKPEIYARGVRNTVGFDWHPITQQLWFTDNGADMLGDDIPPEELNRIAQAGQHFGYPYCHAGDIADPEHGSKHDCSEFTAPEVKFQAHAAGLGMRFYTGRLFPAEYHDQIFIAQHGSWNRSKKVGYQLMLVTLPASDRVGNQASAPKPEAKVFAEGWLRPDESVWGRPVDVLVMPDGALLVSDDYAGAIYRIGYEGR